MESLISAFFSVVDWRFSVGLLAGVALTLRYVVIGFYHPIIREQMEKNAARGDRDDKSQ